MHRDCCMALRITLAGRSSVKEEHKSSHMARSRVKWSSPGSVRRRSFGRVVLRPDVNPTIFYVSFSGQSWLHGTRKLPAQWAKSLRTRRCSCECSPQCAFHGRPREHPHLHRRLFGTCGEHSPSLFEAIPDGYRFFRSASHLEGFHAL